ncbi:hypothetical protein QN277_023112 [Acacia crassicarpa]|uniref:Uncharacterized protein n=1 Tax=Acacia crassicarpa TaxID=499986 RepID=A0AAE1MLN5_9FABA|nr:hypothetical protein QN277_023112 [Acacia crassicarpa]
MKCGSAVNMPSSYFGVSENEYDCESEEGIEALVEQQPLRSVPPRSSSKRNRAAKVHNLSEKTLKGTNCLSSFMVMANYQALRVHLENKRKKEDNGERRGEVNSFLLEFFLLFRLLVFW